MKIYQSSGGKLILKNIEQIRDAIKAYLIGKVTEYNALLNEQIYKRNNGYYNSLSAQFNYLGQFDSLANPNNHNYSQNSIPADYFIKQLVIFLDTLQNSPEYGKKAIYGNSTADTTDEKLDMIAKLLYYQNITWPERLEQDTVNKDITEIKNSFDINQKIQYVTKTYLTKDNDQGKFITPLYNATGYEVGYINSDGDDYVVSKPTPAFIQQIQNVQKTGSTTATPANAFNEAITSSDMLQAQVDSCE